MVVALAVTLFCGTEMSHAAKKTSVADLTRGGTKDDKHDWNLGPTGARGWIWGRSCETTSSRQILITAVDKASPADGVLEVGDVILGAGGAVFTQDARKSLGRAITRAEGASGLLKLIRWRKGRRQSVQIKLAAMGSYSPTAPQACGKSQRILAAACRHIAKNLKRTGLSEKINALGLLAAGDARYAGLLQDFARRAAPSDLKLKLHASSGKAAWIWGYTNLFLTEYHLATGDTRVLPAIRQYSMNIARGQSAVGTWGHGMAWPELNGGAINGRLGGYGALNQAGLICHMSLVLARKCGVKDHAVRRAIDRANTFFEFYVSKGSIPYGDHRPGWTVHDDNGKNSIAAITFDLQDRRPAARFFSRMTVASYGERERGHTGNYFSFLWGPLGANRSGPRAAAAFLKELRWYYDLARRPDGSFVYQGAPAGRDKYHRWDCTGPYILAYALPLKKLYITGKGTNKANELTGSELSEVIAAGRGFNSWDMGIGRYRGMSAEKLFECLRSWSPAVRHRAAQALAGRKDANPIPKLLNMLGGSDPGARYGACQAFAALRRRAAPAVGALRRALSDDDVWLRIQASYALASIGGDARDAIPDMLKLAVRDDDRNDPRRFTQRYLSFCLFYPGGALRMRGLIAHSLDGVDRQLLYAAVKKLLANDDGRARGAVGSVYRNLTYKEVKPLLKAVCRAIVEPSPSGVMFSGGIRLRGLELLARHRIAEGIPLCMRIMKLEGWGRNNRIRGCLRILAGYGGAAKSVIGELKEFKRKLGGNRRQARMMKGLIEQIDKTISQIESAKNTPKLRTLGFTP